LSAHNIFLFLDFFKKFSIYKIYLLNDILDTPYISSRKSKKAHRTSPNNLIKNALKFGGKLLPRYKSRESINIEYSDNLDEVESLYFTPLPYLKEENDDDDNDNKEEKNKYESA
jgi:hypothetical protein